MDAKRPKKGQGRRWFGGEGRDVEQERRAPGSGRWGRLARVEAMGWREKGWSLGRSVGMTLDSYCCCY